MTERLYYHNSYLTEFKAHVVEVNRDCRRIYLDCTAFYPTSGGQPFDTGELGGSRVVEVIDEGDRIAHILSEPLTPGGSDPRDGEVHGRIDFRRRFDHMQQHTGQHLLSAVLIGMFDAPTVSFHMGAESSTIDLARSLDPPDLRTAEHRANQIVFENRPITVRFQHSPEDLGLRKPTERHGEIRIISIENLDRTACGGTHVRATGEIGPILLRKTDRVRGNLRIEFLCGARAIARARTDFEALSEVARLFSAPLDEAPGLVEAQREKLVETEKVRKGLATELAQASGRALYSDTPPGADGVRRALRRVNTLTEECRIEAPSFTWAGPAVLLVMAQSPPAILLAASPDSGIDAGDLLKRALSEAGGRGGGNRTLAQGSLPSEQALAEVAARLARELGLPG